MKTFVKLFAVAFALFLTGSQAKANNLQTIDWNGHAVEWSQEISSMNTPTIVSNEVDEEGPQCSITVSIKSGIFNVGFTVSGECSEIGDAFEAQWDNTVNKVRDTIKKW